MKNRQNERKAQKDVKDMLPAQIQTTSMNQKAKIVLQEKPKKKANHQKEDLHVPHPDLQLDSECE